MSTPVLPVRARPAKQASAVRALRSERPLLHEEGACLPLRSIYGQCRACVDACPVAALSVSTEAVTLSDACMGCGRCIAACPTQALSLEDLAGVLDPATQPDRIRFECRKVPPGMHAAGTRVVPCLGTLTVGNILALHTAGAVIEVVDRGWCGGCDANTWLGGSPEERSHPAAKALEEAVLWLESLGCEDLPLRVEEKLPPASRPDRIPPPAASEEETAPKLGRRGLLFRSARPGSELRRSVTPMGGGGRAAYPAEARRPSTERQQRLEALGALAAKHEAALPNDLFPQMSVDQRCCDRRMCVALCPTAALSVTETEAGADLAWSSERCIACGTCVRACPEGAMHLSPHGGGPGWRVLASHERMRCAACGDRFTPTADQRADAGSAICPTCAKAQRFMDDARRQLFGTRS